MHPAGEPDPYRYYHPDQMLDNVINIVNHMRLQQKTELDAINASIHILLESAAFIVVRCSKDAVAATEMGRALMDQFAVVLESLNAAREDKGGGIPTRHPEYAGAERPAPGQGPCASCGHLSLIHGVNRCHFDHYERGACGCAGYVRRT